MIDAILGRRVYLDANVFIYALESFPRYSVVCGQNLKAIENSEIMAVTSELTLAEVLVGPLRLGHLSNVAAYDELLQTSQSLEMVPITRSILTSSAAIRAAKGGKLPDAIHAASAAASSCKVFVTGDQSIRLPESIPLLTLDTLAQSGRD